MLGSLVEFDAFRPEVASVSAIEEWETSGVLNFQVPRQCQHSKKTINKMRSFALAISTTFPIEERRASGNLASTIFGISPKGGALTDAGAPRLRIRDPRLWEGS